MLSGQIPAHSRAPPPRATSSRPVKTRTRVGSSPGGVPYSVARKTGKAAMVGKIEGLGGNLGDIAWIDEAGLA